MAEGSVRLSYPHPGVGRSLQLLQSEPKGTTLYTVQHYALIVVNSPIGGEAFVGNAWADIYVVPQLETQQAELTEARRIVTRARGVYRDVRILKSLPDGSTKVVI